MQILLVAILPALITEIGTTVRAALKERRKERERLRTEEIKALQARIEKLELAARWSV